LNVIKSNLAFTFSKRFDFIALKFFCLRSLIAFGFMSMAKIFFLSRNFDAVSDKIPEPVPMSRYELILFFFRYFFRKSEKKYESSAG